MLKDAKQLLSIWVDTLFGQQHRRERKGGERRGFIFPPNLYNFEGAVLFKWEGKWIHPSLSLSFLLPASHPNKGTSSCRFPFFLSLRFPLSKQSVNEVRTGWLNWHLLYQAVSRSSSLNFVILLLVGSHSFLPEKHNIVLIEQLVDDKSQPLAI